MSADEVTETDEVAVDESIDHRQVMADIQAEARRLRREGVVSAAFERELDVVFGRLAPPAASDDFDATLTAAEELAYVDAVAPVLSEKPAGAVMKKLVRKAVFFYGKYLTDQITEFATTAARSIRLLGRRVDAIEEAVPGTSARVRQELVATTPAGSGAQWADAITARLPRDLGRVLVGESGAGALVRELVDRGFDVYGVEPRSQSADEAAAGGLEVREDDVLDHLRLVASASLGGAVLVGCVDRLALGQQLALLDRVASALVPGGGLAVVTEGLTAGRSAEQIVVADLSPGRPLHPPTWQHLLAHNGFEGVQILEGENQAPGAAVIVGRRSAR